MSEDVMFDFADFYDRMVRQMPDECRVIEIGVADGISALYLAKELHRLGRKFKLYMADNMDYGGMEQIKKIYENIIKSGLGEFIEVIPYDSITASKKFNDGFFDFVFIDASHRYEETKEDIKAWYPKVIDGGILGGHDFFLYPEVALAVTELIPEFITREPLEEQTFETEKFLHIEGTDRGYGLFWCQKNFYKKLNP